MGSGKRIIKLSTFTKITLENFEVTKSFVSKVTLP